MRLVLGALWMITTLSLAAPAPLRFAISDSWAMPLVQIEAGQPTQGILYDLMLSLATQVGHPVQFQVLARARIAPACLVRALRIVRPAPRRQSVGWAGGE